jgi:hypothetical protein
VEKRKKHSQGSSQELCERLSALRAVILHFRD